MSDVDIINNTAWQGIYSKGPGEELNVLDTIQNNIYFLTYHHSNVICYNNIDFFFKTWAGNSLFATQKFHHYYTCILS